ncbi:DUF2817 domain-containing protein [Frigidibacter sp. RF13]|uniref:DUF2817 domain-containing protein n=1 Tax=Frigidibacter sp. RF13 TaxID=2997340 RepID=UPI00226D547E|nr:DUF2817 domain-containing protein [Frigidibacter sp. RF13]MCY1127538.1 DUF2817 domain-containing protein [Frigidibacter sp. RF13]
MTYFADSYQGARQNFLEAAERSNARIKSYPQPHLRGLDGEVLSVDVAELGVRHASHVALVIAGTHGAEGYAASAIMCRWLDGRTTLPTGVGVALVHAVNPWSFSFKTRTTENNVDLNRNFLSAWSVRENLAYRELAQFLHCSPMDAQEMLNAYRSYRAYLDTHGWHLENDILSGQTDHPDGLYYAGTGPEWANTNFRRILQAHAGKASHVGFIDFHTGVGEFGEVVHLVCAPKGSEARRQAMQWWKLDEVDGSPFKAGALPAYQGLLCQAISDELPDCRVAGAVVEFGTSDAYGMFRSDGTDRWLRNEGRSDPAVSLLRDQYRNACTPPDVPWRKLVLDAGPRCIDDLVTGLSEWTG